MLWCACATSMAVFVAKFVVPVRQDAFFFAKVGTFSSVSNFDFGNFRRVRTTPKTSAEVQHACAWTSAWSCWIGQFPVSESDQSTRSVELQVIFEFCAVEYCLRWFR